LSGIAEGVKPSAIKVGVGENGDFVYS
jgi:hypothetical protein